MIRSQTARLVAPRVGAWIETLLGAGLNLFGQSLPVWERGLKQTALLLLHLYSVAPRVGAWIETSFGSYAIADTWVAPRVGAWIETETLRVSL